MKTRTIKTLTLASFALIALAAEPVSAQVVQLPTFHTFSYSGSVLVPDRGTTSLGGVSRSASSSRRSLGSRNFGSSTSAAGASVTATIIDHDAIDRQIRGEQLQPRPVAISKVEEGKSLVRFARAQYRGGDSAASFQAYQMAIEILDGRLERLATAEFRRVFGIAAEQVLAAPNRRQWLR